MATLRSRVAGRDRELFVARTPELEFFDSVLRGDSPIRIVHVGGVAGIGKSALLREVTRRAQEHGFDTVWLDGLAPTVVCTPASGTAFQVGTSTVTCTATDGAGLTASSSFTVTVTSTPVQPPAPTTPTTTPGALPPTGSSSTHSMIVLAGLLVAVGLALAATRRRQTRRA